MVTWTAAPLPVFLPPDQVAVWQAALDWPLDLLRAWTAWLDPAEQQRAARFHFPRDRQRFVARRVLLRALLGSCLELSPAQVTYHYGSHGKPAVARQAGASKELCFNASHSAGRALVAAAWQRPLGIDLEMIRPEVEALQVAERFFSPGELADLRSLAPGDRPAGFFAAWTRKEAYVKAVGQGLSLPLEAFDVSLIPGQPARLLAARQGLPGPETWDLHDLEPTPGFAGALCLAGPLDAVQHWRLDDPVGWLARQSA